MKNFEQIRAKNALSSASGGTSKAKEGGEVAKKVPTMIRENGLIATLAFALEKKAKGGDDINSTMKNIMDGIVNHLRDPAIASLTSDVKDAHGWLHYLANEATSAELRVQTDEAMAYLNYFRRFATKE